MTPEELDSIQKRLDAGTIKPSDVRMLILELRSVLQPEQKQPDTETETPKLTEEALEERPIGESQEEVVEVQQEAEESPKRKHAKSK